MKSRTQYSVALGGFGSAIFVAVLLVAAYDAVRFHPSEDAPTRFQLIMFDVVIWGGALLIFGGTGFGLAMTPFLRRRPALPSPLFVGIVAGVIFCALAFFGITTRYGRLLGLPFSATVALSGMVSALCAVGTFFPIALLTRRVRKLS